MKQKANRINIPIAIASLIISLWLFWIVLPSRMSNRLQRFRVDLTSVPYGFDPKRFYIEKQQTAINVHARVTDQEYKDFAGSATAEANLTDAQPGTHQYPVSLYPPALRSKIVEGELPQATFTLEAVKSREVPVIVVSSGKLIDPTETVDVKPETRRATVDGPASDVAKVVSARAVLRLDSLDPHAITQQVALEPVNAEDQVVEHVDIHPAQVTVTTQYSLAPQQKQVFVETVFADGQVPDGYAVKSYSVDPSHISVSGSSQALSRIAKVSTDKIDVSKMTYTQTLTVQLKPLPGNVKMTPNSVQVTIVVEPIKLKGLSPKTPSGSPIGGTKTGITSTGT